MAARPETTTGLQIVDLRRVHYELLLELLQEEVEAWRASLHWDFQPSADLLLRYVSTHALDGLAMIRDGSAIGYTYYITEQRKGLIGDLYLRMSHRTAENERALLGAVLDSMIRSPYINRIEAQLMMMRNPARGELGGAPQPQAFPRQFMLASLAGAPDLPAKKLPGRIAFERWGAQLIDATAALIAQVYRNHVDSRINDQYRSQAGARRFLQNIVQYPGCGQFHQPGSWVAINSSTGDLLGVSLASFVAQQVGHLTQICVSRNAKGTGLGYELMRRSMNSLAEAGAREISLTVTRENTDAISLYERVGFSAVRFFDALVWEGFL